ncbi:MAG: succinate--CoA ligase [ADP-forming] subunit beta [Lysobacterales bacterium]|jgi:succinyl-CoA synthetase beta subunit|nr:MAG: succinate--CoA ligase [ADP-forming] subunit beta [Xanthomonadales bacterium]
MNFHEYQAKLLFDRYGIPVPRGEVAATPEQAQEVATRLGGDRFVVKAQIHAGGRGKAGGVKLVDSPAAARDAAAAMLGRRMSTYQSGGRALPVERVLVAEATAIARELYLSLLLDRAEKKLCFVASAEGGMDIEQVAATRPEAIHRINVDPVAGLMPYQCRRLGFAFGLSLAQIQALTRIMTGMLALFRDKDLSLIELNPLAIDEQGRLIAVDGKITADDNALFRQPDLVAMRDPGQEDPIELQASEHHLNYVSMEGDIACMVNGAGLAMATMDVIKLAGGEPANFLDVGGGTNAERVAAAFKLILANPRVKAILVNIFGGIVRCDLIAEGIIRAVREVGCHLPVVVRLEGTHAEEGRRMLAESGLRLTPATDLDDAARKVVALARATS